MATTNEDGKMNFICSAVLARARRVKIASDRTVSYAGLGERADGITLHATEEIGDSVTVALRNKPGTVKVTAAGAFARGANLYSAANGKVDDVSTSAGNIAYLALEAATADGDIVEVMVLHAETA